MQTKELVDVLKNYSVIASEEQASNLLKLMELTLKANEVMNLTAIKKEDEFLEKMIIDSAIVFKPGDLENKSLLDVGSGAGFPGLVIAILYPTCHVTCLDSTTKKMTHVAKTAQELGLSNVETVADRAENYVKKHREEFDVVISRAVASLNILAELCGAFVKINGVFIAMKSLKADEEITEAKKSIKTMGLTQYKMETTTLPFNHEQRFNIFFSKTSSCQRKYPRDYKEIKGKPL